MRKPDNDIGDPTTEYAHRVLGDEGNEDHIVAGPYVRGSCQRHLNDLEQGAERGLKFSTNAANRVLAFFPARLRLTQGQYEGAPFVLSPWEEFVVGSCFGWYEFDKDTKQWVRRFRIAYVETSKGSGKTPLAAGIALYMLGFDFEPRAEVYVGAYNQEQANVLFSRAVAMVEMSPELSAIYDLRGQLIKTQIDHQASGSKFRPISTERMGRGKSGPIPHCGILDEVHELPTADIVEFIKAGTKQRRSPLIFKITNSGAEKAGPCWDYHEYARQIAEGTIENDSWFTYVCALDEGEDPLKDESCWPKVNPSLPELPGTRYLRQQVKEAAVSAANEEIVRRLHFCQWYGGGTFSWLRKEVWDGCLVDDLDIDKYEGMPCYGGLDLSLNSDLTALVLVFETGPMEWDAFSFFWLPGDRLNEIEQAIGLPGQLRQWQEWGHLFAPPGKIINYKHVAAEIQKMVARFDFRHLCYDRAKIELLQTELEELECFLDLIPHPQGFNRSPDYEGLWMPNSIDQTQASIVEGRLRVKTNAVLTWCVASAQVLPSPIEPANRRFDKTHSEPAKIDGAVALVQAIGGAIYGVSGSVYDERGFIFV